MRGSEWNRVGLAVAAVFLVVAGGLVARQQADSNKPPLTFDVAAVKPTPADDPRRGGMIRQTVGNQGYMAYRVPLRLIMTVAYTVTDRQISGGPDWVNGDFWNIDAKAERSGTSDELHAALARLIEDRFKLKIRHETRDLPAYILTVDKKGSKMPVHDPADLDHPPMGGTGLGAFEGKNETMNYFAFFLSRILDRNVIDRTGLPARYDVAFHFVPDLPPGDLAGRGGGEGGGPAAALPDGPDIFTALREQLGLRLEKGTGPVDFLVIEHVEKPAEN